MIIGKWKIHYQIHQLMSEDIDSGDVQMVARFVAVVDKRGRKSTLIYVASYYPLDFNIAEEDVEFSTEEGARYWCEGMADNEGIVMLTEAQANLL